MAQGLIEGGGNLTPDTFVGFCLELRKLRRELDEVNGRYRATRKRAKSAGVALDSLAMVEAFAKLDDDAAFTRLKQFQRYAAWLELPFGTQPSLFADPGLQDAPGQTMTAALSLAQHEEEGYAAGKRGDDRAENANEGGSEAFAAWDRGWIAGQRTIADRMSSEEPKKTRPRKPRLVSDTSATRLGV